MKPALGRVPADVRISNWFTNVTIDILWGSELSQYPRTNDRPEETHIDQPSSTKPRERTHTHTPPLSTHTRLCGCPGWERTLVTRPWNKSLSSYSVWLLMWRRYTRRLIIQIRSRPSVPSFPPHRNRNSNSNKTVTDRVVRCLGTRHCWRLQHMWELWGWWYNAEHKNVINKLLPYVVWKEFALQKAIRPYFTGVVALFHLFLSGVLPHSRTSGPRFYVKSI